MAGHFREADTRWAQMLEVLTMSSGPGVLGVNSRSNGLLLAYLGHLTEARATGLAQVRESAARGQGGPADIGRYIVARTPALRPVAAPGQAAAGRAARAAHRA
jgi:hypothetical protein